MGDWTDNVGDYTRLLEQGCGVRAMSRLEDVTMTIDPLFFRGRGISRSDADFTIIWRGF